MKKNMKTSKTTAIIEKNASGYGIFTPDIEGCTIIGEGKTVAEAKEDFFNSVEEVREMYAEDGKEAPEWLKDFEVEFKYDVSSLFNEYAFINASKFAAAVGISPSLMRHYKAGDTYISAAQAKKIQDGLHGLARKLASVNLI